MNEQLVETALACVREAGAVLLDYHRKVETLIQKVKSLTRRSLSKKSTNHLHKSLDDLFDIARCSCNLPVVPCSDKFIRCQQENCILEHIACMCSEENRIPKEDRAYLRDQRTKKNNRGKYQLGTIQHVSPKRRPNTSIPSIVQDEESRCESEDSQNSENVSLYKRNNLVCWPDF